LGGVGSTQGANITADEPAHPIQIFEPRAISIFRIRNFRDLHIVWHSDLRLIQFRMKKKELE
jgi:hypothetical protein